MQVLGMVQGTKHAISVLWGSSMAGHHTTAAAASAADTEDVSAATKQQTPHGSTSPTANAASAGSSAHSHASSSSSLTEEQLAGLFDQELQQRLARAAQQAAERSKAAAARSYDAADTMQHQAAAPAGEPTAVDEPIKPAVGQLQQHAPSWHLQQPSVRATTPSTNSSGSSRGWMPSVQAVPSTWPAAAAAVLSPLLSADPWAPLPTPAAVR